VVLVVLVAGGASLQVGPQGDGLLEQGRRLRPAEREVDDVGALVGRPDDARRDLVVVAAAVRVEHPAREDPRAAAGGGDARAVAGLRCGGLGDRRPVAVLVVGVVVAGDEVAPGQERGVEVRMVRIDAGVEDRDGRAGRVGLEVPGGGQPQGVQPGLAALRALRGTALTMTVPRPRKALQGDEGALYEALAGELVRVVSRLVNTDRATIDDACQFAWLQLLRCQPHRETVRPWLITVARHEAIRLDRIRRRSEPMSIGERQAGEHPEPAASADTHALAIDLDEALRMLASLPPRQRDLYALKVLGFTTKRSLPYRERRLSSMVIRWVHSSVTCRRRRSSAPEHGLRAAASKDEAAPASPRRPTGH